MTANAAATRPLLAFSIDFEGWTEAMQESIELPADLPRFDIEPELERNADACLALLARHNVRGTFFMLGWIGEKFPHVVRRISDAGHEMGSHSHWHKRLTGLTQDEARRDIARSKAVLEDVTGRPVFGFRAPDFSLDADGWMPDCLVETGFTYDSSSVATSIREDYGKGWTRSSVHTLANGLVEFPIPTKTLFGRLSLPVGGGGYFRLFPWALTGCWLAEAPDPATYLHPYEIGGAFPRSAPMSFLRRIRHAHGNGNLDGKLARLFAAFEAMPVADYLRIRHGLAVDASVSRG
jgi:polysaccharide deacetylase family protein (PEP-CTERM system associated)